MYEEPKLSEAEWAPILELLERERGETAGRNPPYPQFERTGGTTRAGGNGAEFARPPRAPMMVAI